MTIGERVKKLREAKRLTQSELAEKLGYKSKSSVAHIENGRDIPRTVIVKLSEVLDTSPAYLMGWEDEKNHERSNIGAILNKEKIHMIPVFESVSAGFGAYANSDIQEFIPMFIENPYDVSDTICIKVSGDSMYPKIEDGDKIIVHRQDEVDSGRIAVVMIGDEAVVKKVKFEDNGITLISINPEYAPRTIRGRELENVHIVGLVQQVLKAL